LILGKGQKVEHPEYGTGTVLDILGDIARVNYYGEQLDTPVIELTWSKDYHPGITLPIDSSRIATPEERKRFRRSFEAINLGVVPPDPEHLIALTIGRKTWVPQIRSWLQNAFQDGLCKAVFGYYGAGKSHYLNLVRCVALKEGWVVSFLEFDPKSADPAKPHLIYRNIASSLQFPEKEDGSRTVGFPGFIKELREKWNVRSIRQSCRYLNINPWFLNAIEILLKYPHSQDEDYISGCGWLCGENQPIQIMNNLAIRKGCSNRVPRMPRVRETADIYVLHLVTLHHLCKAMGYKGLLILLDEAEHVRGYNVRRKERANNLFDLLARAAHPPVSGDDPPGPNDHGVAVPTFWKEGPHFGLLVGLTDGTSILPGQEIRDECVFLHNESDRIQLTPPSAIDYARWCEIYFEMAHQQYPSQTRALSEPTDRRTLSELLRNAYEKTDRENRVLRNWIKLASLAPCMALAGNADNAGEIAACLEHIAPSCGNDPLPWEY
jgi:hypothetical protein